MFGKKKREKPSLTLHETLRDIQFRRKRILAFAIYGLVVLFFVVAVALTYIIEYSIRNWR